MSNLPPELPPAPPPELPPGPPPINPYGSPGQLSPPEPSGTPNKGSVILGCAIALALPIATLMLMSFVAGIGINSEAPFVILAVMPLAALVAIIVLLVRAGHTRTIGGLLIGVAIEVLLVVSCFAMLAGTNFH